MILKAPETLEKHYEEYSERDCFYLFGFRYKANSQMQNNLLYIRKVQNTDHGPHAKSEVQQIGKIRRKSRPNQGRNLIFTLQI